MSSSGKAQRKYSEYGLLLAVICMALALVLAKYWRQQFLVEFQSSVPNSANVDPRDGD
jgi:hypothetical protein